MPKKFSVGSLQKFTDPYWGEEAYSNDQPEWTDGRYFVELAQEHERAGLDFVFFLDTQAVLRRSDGSMDAALKIGFAEPDPMYLLPLIAAATTHIGIVATASTTFYPPFLLARAFSTIDGIADGRVGWNIVTSYEKNEAANYGITEVLPHAERYDRAEEFLDVVRKLWESWEPDAVIRDLASMTYVDPTKVHSVDHVGKYFRSQGPLVTTPSRQRVPFLAQAGASPRGRDFAARHAELTFVDSAAASVEELRATRDDIRERAKRMGRDPDDINVTYSVLQQFLADDFDQNLPVPVSEFSYDLALMATSQTLDIDLSEYPEDESFPVDTPPSGLTSIFENFVNASKRGLTLREAVIEQYVGVDPKRPAREAPGFHGTPEQVADKVLDFMEDVGGGDGIILTGGTTQRGGSVPHAMERFMERLREAGVVRSGYVEGATLRESMRALRD